MRRKGLSLLLSAVIAASSLPVMSSTAFATEDIMVDEEITVETETENSAEILPEETTESVSVDNETLLSDGLTEERILLEEDPETPIEEEEMGGNLIEDIVGIQEEELLEEVQDLVPVPAAEEEQITVTIRSEGDPYDGETITVPVGNPLSLDPDDYYHESSRVLHFRDNEGNTYEPDQEMYFEKDTVLTIEWIESDRYVLFDANGGTIEGMAAKSCNYDYDDDSVALDNMRAVRDGYIMTGWENTETGERYMLENGYISSQTFNEMTVNNHVTLKALWTKPIHVTLDFGGDYGWIYDWKTRQEIQVPYIVVDAYPETDFFASKYSEQYSLIDNNGRVASGWIDENGDDVGKRGFIASSELHDGMRLTLRWEEPITITANANGGYWVDDGSEIRTVESAKEDNVYLHTCFSEEYLANDNEDLIFRGWSFTPDGEIIDDDDLQMKLTSNTSIYAIWKKACTVTWDGNGGASEWEEDEDGSPLRLYSKRFAEGSILYSHIPDSMVYDGEGKGFKGWALDPEGKEMVVLENGGYKVTGDVTFYAVYEDYISVTIDGNGGTVTVCDENDNRGDIETYQMNCVEGETFRPEHGVFRKKGYVLTSWIDSDGKEYDVSQYITAKKDMVLYAVYTKGIPIHFDPNGGRWADWAPENEESRAVSTFDAIPGDSIATWSCRAVSDEPGMVLLGWSLTADGKAEYSAESDIPGVTEETTFYAVYGEPCNITYKANGGCVNGDEEWKRVRCIVGKGYDLIEEAPIVTCDGKVFCGWTYKKDDPSTAIIQGSENALAQKDTFVYAYWSDPVQLTFDGNGQKLILNNEEKTTFSATAGKGFPFVQMPSYKGTDRTLVGWSLTNDGSRMVIDYTKGESAFTPNGDMTLYSVWKKTADAAETVKEDPASVEAVSKQIAQVTDKKEVTGSSFTSIQLQSKKQTKNAITVKWNKVKGADGYIVYGNRSGSGNRLEQQADTAKTSYKAGSLKAGKYYKFCVAAYKTVNGKKQVIATSKQIHVATKGSRKAANISKVKVNKSKVTLKPKKTFRIKASETKSTASGKIKNYRKLRYESSDPTVAKVTASGKIIARKPGRCVIYVYSQTGTYAKVSVAVKK